MSGNKSRMASYCVKGYSTDTIRKLDLQSGLLPNCNRPAEFRRTLGLLRNSKISGKIVGVLESRQVCDTFPDESNNKALKLIKPTAVATDIPQGRLDDKWGCRSEFQFLFGFVNVRL